MDNTIPLNEQNFEVKPNLDSNFSTYQDSSQDLSQNSSVKNPSKKRYAIFGGLVILVLVFIVIALIIFILAKSKDDDDANEVMVNDGSADVDSGVESAVSVAFKNLTKAEAVAFLQSRMGDADELLPEGYVGEEITNSVILAGRNLVVSDLDLVYSYDDAAELEQLIREKYSSFSLPKDEVKLDDFEIKEYDYYTIVALKGVKDAASCTDGGYDDCDAMLSFKREYLNYFREETSPSYFRDAFYVNSDNLGTIEELLRIYTFFVSVGLGGHGNIYSYSFDEQADKYVLTVNYVSVGFDMGASDNSDSYTSMSKAYAINLFTRRYAVDKSDGHIYAIPVQTEPEVSYSDYVKSFPVTREEAAALLGYGD